MRVLIVDDRSRDRDLLRLALLRLGVQALTAANLSEAESLLRAAGGFEAVITTLDLERGVDGLAVARMAGSVAPATRMVFVTDGKLAKFGALKQGPLLEQGSSFDDLARRVRDAIWQPEVRGEATRWEG